MNSKRNSIIIAIIAYVVGLFHCRWCWEKELTGRTFVDDIRDSIGSINSNSKVHWHIRLDTWIGWAAHKLFRGHLDGLIMSWYDNKYPAVEDLFYHRKWESLVPGAADVGGFYPINNKEDQS